MKISDYEKKDKKSPEYVAIHSKHWCTVNHDHSETPERCRCCRCGDQFTFNNFGSCIEFRIYDNDSIENNINKFLEAGLIQQSEVDEALKKLGYFKPNPKKEKLPPPPKDILPPPPKKEKKPEKLKLPPPPKDEHQISIEGKEVKERKKKIKVSAPKQPATTDLPSWWKSENPWCIDDYRNNTIPDESIDLIPTSPPYNLEIQYGEYKDNKSWDEYTTFLKEFLEEASRILKPDGVLALNVGNQRNSGLSHHVYFLLLESKFTIIKEIVWFKGLYYIPPESIFICSKSGNYKHTYPKNDEFYSNDQFAMLWKIRYGKNETHEKVGHPAFFPEKLSTTLILSTTDPGDIIYDPFLGSGTTLRSARKTNRIGIGHEMDIDMEPLIIERTMSKTPKMGAFE